MNLLKEWGDKLEQLGPVAQRVGKQADGYVCRIIALLEDLNAGVANLYPGVNAYEYPRLAVGAGAAGSKMVEGRQGYLKIIENVAIIAPAAADVDLFIMSLDNSCFVQRWSLAAAGRVSNQVAIPVPEGQPIFVQSSVADVQVNLIVRRIKP